MPPAGGAVRRFHVPVRDSTPDWGSVSADDGQSLGFAVRHYLDITRTGAAAFGRVLSILAGPGALPAVFFCAAGKDRTGVLAALVLHLLDVAPETIAADYALSDRATARWEAWIGEGNDDDTATAWSVVPQSLLVADAEVMMRYLGELNREYPTREELCAALGVDTATLAALRRALLD